MDEESKPGETKRNHLISRRKFHEFVEDHPGIERDLETLIDWCKIVEKSDWRTFAQVRKTFPHADQIDDMICFNVGGNKYRVLALVRYRKDNAAKVLIRLVMTHPEYNKWK